MPEKNSRYGRTTALMTRLTTLGLVAAGAAVAIGATAAPAVASSPSGPANCTSKATSVANNTPVAIPTGPAVVSSTVAVSGAGKYLLDVDAITGLHAHLLRGPRHHAGLAGWHDGDADH